MKPKKGLVPLGLLVLLTKVGRVVAHTPGGEGGGGGRDAAWIYALAAGAPVAVTLLFLGYVYASAPKEGGSEDSAHASHPPKPRVFDYTVVGNQLVVTYEGDATWERDELAVRYGANGGGEETVEMFETNGDDVEQGDAVSVNTGDTGGKVEVVWNGEAVDEWHPEV